LAKQQLWVPTNEDGYIDHDTLTPSLVPVFDPAFVKATIVSPPSPALPHHASQIPPPALIPLAPTTPLRNDNETNSFEDRGTLSLEFPEIDDDLESVDFRDWTSWNAPRRIAAVRRWIIHAAHKYGPMERWGEDLSEEWSSMKYGDAPTVRRWLARATRRVKMGRSVLNYLERAMEGELSPGVEEWRDLYAQSHQLACQLWGGVLGIQYRLDFMSGPYASS
jgi:hypothetical protein